MPTIDLNTREAQLKALLLDVSQYIGRSSEQAPVLRWAGGWVRDKLLGVESHDIDTAIDSMTGEAFAIRLCDFCDVDAHRKRHAIGPADVGQLHKIARNPDKSKHLETTTTRLFGLDVDFVNLRRETYTEDSRNPQMEFGTAEEDSLRRDATVNALFYNLHTGLVEDFTGGLEDMRAKLIRTPLEPLSTFTDDPLRVLRLVRFASRLGFEIDAEAEGVMADPRVLDALRLKISRERVGVELEKMLKGQNPCESLKFIDRLGLYHTIFTDPERPDMPQPDLSNWSAAYKCLDLLAKNKTPGSIYESLVTTEEARYFAWSLAALTPWEQLPDHPPIKSTKPALPLATQAAREGFKATNKLTEVVTAAHRHRRAILELKDIVCTKQASMRERDRFGMAIREWDARGGHWRLQVLFSILVDVEERTRTKCLSGADTPVDAETVEDVLAEWQKLLDHLVELDVVNAPSMKRVVDGRVLSKALGVKPGPWMTQALDVAMAWQLRNPGETDPAGGVEEVRKRKAELGIK
ncbi:hypothetical protein B0T22DRAFT_498578 [Podospora appendiculata]|uniref:Poly A polymerase head domain-containing protein n=1 Tax=Podospora appendiculata TaxID=314037 RepID=A0AAE0XA50_9PEZI|nr:hypothetical protein B0T22DRAFT_498578 [Podospora appendiculata]